VLRSLTCPRTELRSEGHYVDGCVAVIILSSLRRAASLVGEVLHDATTRRRAEGVWLAMLIVFQLDNIPGKRTELLTEGLYVERLSL
jgi:hypothetical protein